MVKAISNKFGSTTASITFPSGSVRVHKKNQTSTTSSNLITFTKDKHIRGGRSSNPFRVLPGLKPFRDPSTYTRLMVNLVRSSPASYSTEDDTYITEWSGYPLIGSSDYVPLWTFPVNENGVFQPSWDMDQTITECLAKLKDRKVDVGTYLAESIKTANQLADLASSLYRDLLDYSRRIRTFRRNPWGISREVADGYLGFKYGIRPLANDLYTMAQVWNAGGLDNPLVVSASHSLVTRHSRYNDSGSWTDRQQQTVNLTQVKLFGTINSEWKRNASRVGLADPAIVAWELVPYSFVIDWALPVGTFLEALNAAVGLDFLSGFKMQRTSTGVKGSRRLPSNGKGQPLTLEYEALAFQRTKLGSFPTPIPYAKNPFSTSNVLSAVALFRQLLRDRSR